MTQTQTIGSPDPSGSPHDTVRSLRWSNDGLLILDQRKLPDTIDYRLCRSAGDVADAITSMQIRGAPAIGIAAAYGFVLAARECFRRDPAGWRSALVVELQPLAASRPTAVNLFWAIERMQAAVVAARQEPLAELEALADTIHREDIGANRVIGELGAALIVRNCGVLTHCNTGSLATGGYGTALGVIRSAHRRGLTHVYATETRPWLQGARLTLWELQQDRIPATLIADSAAALLMQRGRIGWVIVGADRIAANGDTANKIGTYALAVAARHHGVKMMVVAPTSTIDWGSATGASIVIEERHPSELLPAHYATTDQTVGAWNPVFDVTPAELIDAIVTERGVIERPGSAAMSTLREAPPHPRAGAAA